MKNTPFRISVIVLVLITILSLAAGCGKKGTTTTGSPNKPVTQSYSGGLVTAVADAATVEKRAQAVENIVEKGFSLGLLDENGKQLNPNVAEDAISLSPASMENYANLEAGGYFRTVEYIVGFLADAGVQLESTGAVITVKDFLQDLQKYVDWSFAHPDDPKSVLGLMIASGPDMKVPSSPPTVTAQTMVSPLCSLMIMGDVLIGVENGEGKASAAKSNWLVKKAYAADDSENVVQRIRGLITTIKPLLSIVKSILPEKSLNIIAAFEACDRLSVRMWEVPDSSITEADWNNKVSASLPVAKNLKLEKGKKESITVLGGVGIMSGASGSPLETLEGVQTNYSFQLFSEDQMGLDFSLFDDADAELQAFSGKMAGNFKYTPGYAGHQLTADGKSNAPFILKLKEIENTLTRKGILHAMARITAPADLQKLAEEKVDEKIKNFFLAGIVTSALEKLPWKDIQETMALINRDFQPTPWLCIVEFTPVEKKTTPSTTTTQAVKPSAPTVKIKSPKEGDVFQEVDKIIVSISVIDYLGEPLPEKYIDTNAQWEYDDGSPLICTPLGDGDFEVGTKLAKGPHKITVSIKTKDERGILSLKGSDYVNIKIVPEQLSSLETLLKKNWDLQPYAEGRNLDSNEIRFREDGTFAFRSDAWETSWTLSGSTIKMSMSYDYKSGPNMVTHWEYTGTLVAAEDGDYHNATMHGEFKKWDDWDKDKSLLTGTWTAD
jgi:hypothetical protein